MNREPGAPELLRVPAEQVELALAVEAARSRK
jgi:hypothetical protein